MNAAIAEHRGTEVLFRLLDPYEVTLPEISSLGQRGMLPPGKRAEDSA
jgi:hypothetical protein